MGVVYIVCGRPQIFNLQKDERKAQPSQMDEAE